MLPHPTTSSFCSAIAMRHFERGRAGGARIGLADPSALEHRGAVVAQLAEPNHEFVTLVVVQGRSAFAERVTRDRAELFERELEAGDSRAVRFAAAFESAGGAEVADCLRVEMHQFGIG